MELAVILISPFFKTGTYSLIGSPDVSTIIYFAKKERINIKWEATRALLHKINKNQFLFVNKLVKCCKVTNPETHLRIVFTRHTIVAFKKQLKSFYVNCEVF